MSGGTRSLAYHENVARVRALAAVAEELEQVVELAVDVAADGHRTLHWVYLQKSNQSACRHAVPDLWVGDSRNPCKNQTAAQPLQA